MEHSIFPAGSIAAQHTDLLAHLIRPEQKRPAHCRGCDEDIEDGQPVHITPRGIPYCADCRKSANVCWLCGNYRERGTLVAGECELCNPVPETYIDMLAALRQTQAWIEKLDPDMAEPTSQDEALHAVRRAVGRGDMFRAKGTVLNLLPEPYVYMLVTLSETHRWMMTLNPDIVLGSMMPEMLTEVIKRADHYLGERLGPQYYAGPTGEPIRIGLYGERGTSKTHVYIMTR